MPQDPAASLRKHKMIILCEISYRVWMKIRWADCCYNVSCFFNIWMEWRWPWIDIQSLSFAKLIAIQRLVSCILFHTKCVQFEPWKFFEKSAAWGKHICIPYTHFPSLPEQRPHDTLQVRQMLTATWPLKSNGKPFYAWVRIGGNITTMTSSLVSVSHTQSSFYSFV